MSRFFKNKSKISEGPMTVVEDICIYYKILVLVSSSFQN